MGYPDIWRVGDIKTKFQLDVKNEFQAPCRAKYNTAFSAIKFLCQFHNCDAIFEALKVDVKEKRGGY